MVKIKFLILLLSSALLLTSCGFEYRNSLDEELHNKVSYVHDKNGALLHLIYNDKRYMNQCELQLFRVTTKEANATYYTSFEYEDDVLLSWNGYRYFSYIDTYYSYTTDDPLFIYDTYNVYFREDYNYWEDAFAVANTSEEIIWQDMFAYERSKINFTNPTQVILTSKLCHRIKTYIELEFIDNQWYMILPHDPYTIWTPSDEFVKILVDNEIIST